MCGIAAIFAYDPVAPRVSGPELAAITDSMAARGPDGQGEWRHPDGQVGLGHRRLAIIDLSDAGRQRTARRGHGHRVLRPAEGNAGR